jgi:hypothetical protein
MEILCLNCQRKLTIPEQYAGQQMKCPLCQGVFTAPALPPAGSTAIEPAPALAAPPAPETSPAIALGAPPTSGPAPAAPTLGPAPTTPTPPPAPVPTEHTGRFAVWINPRYLQFVPLALLLLVLVLTLFPWVGVYYGNYGIDTQNAWQVAFGSVSTSSDVEDLSWVKGKKGGGEFGPKEPIDVGVGFLTILYLLGLFVTLFVVVAAIALDFTSKYLPPNVEKFTRWRWVVVAAVALLTFLVMLLQDVVPFSLESRGADMIEKSTKVEEGTPAAVRKYMDVGRSAARHFITRTTWYRWAFWFNFWALVFSVLVMLALLRYPGPPPRIDLWW